ncbi:MAG: CapA family protein [Bacteroidales bacterium]
MRILSTILLTGMLLIAGCRAEKISTENPETETPVESRLSLFFSGDYMQHLPQVNSARRPDGSFDYTGTLTNLSPFFKNADFSILNFETTISERNFTGYPCFHSPKAAMCYLKEVGVKVLMLANNHCCDGGEQGIRTTLAVADSCGFLRSGVYADSADYRRYHPLILQKGEIRLAILNYTYGTNGLPVPAGVIVNHIDTALIMQDLKEARRHKATDIIVFYHWGQEYQPYPDKQQKQLADWTHQQGVTLVVGSHPHVIQPIESVVQDSVVNRITLYSLGNLISNQPEPDCKGALSFYIELVRTKGVPTRYENGAYLFHWVGIDRQVNKTDYSVIPVFSADSLLIPGVSDIGLDIFTEQAYKLITPSAGIKEITSYPPAEN